MAKHDEYLPYYGRFVPEKDCSLSAGMNPYNPYPRNATQADASGASMLSPPAGQDFFVDHRFRQFSAPHSKMASGSSSPYLSSSAGSRKKIRREPESSASSFSSPSHMRLQLSEGRDIVRGAQFYTNFCRLLQQEPPPAPPLLLRNPGRKENGPGKVKVLLRVAGPQEDSGCSSWMTIDQRRKQVNLLEPNQTAPSGSTASASIARPNNPTGLPLAPKMFSFDGIFSPDTSQGEICSAALVDLIHSVVNGVDACLISYGPAKLGKTYSVVGCDTAVSHAGLIPCAIAWLFRLVNEEKEKTGARYTIRISAVEVSGVQEPVTDLLTDAAEEVRKSTKELPAASYLCDDPRFSSPLLNPIELQASTPEMAGQLLDTCLKRRRESGSSSSSHLFFTITVSQFRLDKNGIGGVSGGRNRLQLIDLGSQAGELPLSGLGNVILALINGQKPVVACKESKITQLLKDALNNVTGQTALLCHVSCAVEKYPETLSVIQMASRVHRMRRKRIRTGVGYSSSDGSRMFSSSTSSDPSSSEVSSATTVIFCGNRQNGSDGDPRRLPSVSRIQTNPNLKLTRAPVASPLASPRLPPHSLLTLTPKSPARNPSGTAAPGAANDLIEPVLRPRLVLKPLPADEILAVADKMRVGQKAPVAEECMKTSVTMPEMRPKSLKITKQVQARRAPVAGKSQWNEPGIDSIKRDMIQKWVELQSPEEESPEALPCNFRLSQSTELMIVEDPVIAAETCDVSQQVSQLEILHETHDVCAETPEPSQLNGYCKDDYGISQQDLEDLDALDTLASHLSSQLDLLSVELAESFTDEREVPAVNPVARTTAYIPQPMQPLRSIPVDDVWQPKTATLPRKEISPIPEVDFGSGSLRRKFAPAPPVRSSSVPRSDRFGGRDSLKTRSRSATKPFKVPGSPSKLSMTVPSPDLSHDSGHDSGFSFVGRPVRKTVLGQLVSEGNKRSPSQSSSSGHGSDGNSTVSSAPSCKSNLTNSEKLFPVPVQPETLSPTLTVGNRKFTKLEDIEERTKLGNKPKLWTKLPCFGGNDMH